MVLTCSSEFEISCTNTLKSERFSLEPNSRFDVECCFGDFEIIDNGVYNEFVFNAILKYQSTICLSLIVNICLGESEYYKYDKNAFAFFDHKYLVPLRKFIVTSKCHYLFYADRNYPVEINKLSDSEISVKFILEAPFIHPSWDFIGGVKKSAANRIQKAGTVYSCNFKITRSVLDDILIPVMPMLYPYANKCAFILTDHCDFDTVEKLKVFLYGDSNNGWLGKGLKITKGVFLLSSGNAENDNNGSIENKEYRSLIEDLKKDGSEIVPHAFKSRGN